MDNNYNPNNNQGGYQNPYSGQTPYQNVGGYQNQYQAPYGGMQQYPQTGGTGKDPGQGKGIAAMVLGILSILTCYFYGIIGLVCGIVGFVLAKQSAELSGGKKCGFASAGYICSIIGMVLSGIMLIIYILLFVGVFSAYSWAL